MHECKNILKELISRIVIEYVFTIKINSYIKKLKTLNV